MSLIEIRKRSLTIETTYHEGGPVTDHPLKLAAACAVIKNPYAGRYEPDLMPFMAELRSLGTLLAQELVDTLGKENIEVYSKAAIVGEDGELEHAKQRQQAEVAGRGGHRQRQAFVEPDQEQVGEQDREAQYEAGLAAGFLLLQRGAGPLIAEALGQRARCDLFHGGDGLAGAEAGGRAAVDGGAAHVVEAGDGLRREDHARFGEGVIVAAEGSGSDARVQVKFAAAGTKWLMLAVAKLTPC